MRPSPRCPLFPSTTLFRSDRDARVGWLGPAVVSIAGKNQRVSLLRADFFLQLKQPRSEEHTSELQSRFDLVCRLLLEKKKKIHGNDGAPAVGGVTIGQRCP